jgi:hypothetical protein
MELSTQDLGTGGGVASSIFAKVRDGHSTPDPWIRNPAYDVVFFCAIWWLPLSLMLFGMSATAGTAAFFLLYHLLIRIPHFAATLNFTYLYKDNHEYYRKNWAKYVLVPLVILAAYGVRSRLHSYSLYGTVLVTIMTIWGMQHIAFQIYGILSLYRGRSQARADALLPKIERAIFYELMLLAVFGGIVRLWFPGAAIEPLLHRVSWGISVALIVTCGTYFARIWLRRKTTPVSIPGLLYFATAVSVMVYWPVYDRFGSRIAGDMAFFYVFNGQHCLAYLGLLFHMTSNKQRLQREYGSLRDGGAGFLKFYTPLAVAAAALLGIAIYRYSRAYGLSGLDVRYTNNAIGVLDGIFVVHYYIESLTWKFSNPHNRAVVLPLLNRTRPVLQQSVS